LRVEASEAAARLLAAQEQLDAAESHAREVERLVEVLQYASAKAKGRASTGSAPNKS
jgi:hypothetical protein